jgi:hypothetical protein
MVKFFLAMLLLYSMPLVVTAQTGIYDYVAEKSNGDNIGVCAAAGFSYSGFFIGKGEGWSHTAKGVISVVPMLGIYYHAKLTSRMSIRTTIALGNMTNSFKYAKEFDSLTENYTPVLSSKFNKYTTVRNITPFLEPQIDIGYLFGPYKKLYLIETRIGLGFQLYTSKSKDEGSFGEMRSASDAKRTYDYYSYTYQRSYYGSPLYGSLVTNIYIGVKWQKMMNPLLNRLSAGVQLTLPVPVEISQPGYATIEYKNAKHETFTSEKIAFTLANIGIKLSYNFL